MRAHSPSHPIVAPWRIDYNEQRPHTALCNQTPEQSEEERQQSRTAKDGIF
ncbi:MAG TPA: hypothetical protein DCP41_02750 [Deltaproteobacteria bacterium]|nr:hypothetical protein [Deltaproteobacteria bacterium]